MGIPVEVKWFQSNAVRTKRCILSEANSAIQFAKERGTDPKKPKVEDFSRQRFVFFVDTIGHFMIRFSDLISLEVLDE